MSTEKPPYNNVSNDLCPSSPAANFVSISYGLRWGQRVAESGLGSPGMMYEASEANTSARWPPSPTLPQMHFLTAAYDMFASKSQIFMPVNSNSRIPPHARSNKYERMLIVSRWCDCSGGNMAPNPKPMHTVSNQFSTFPIHPPSMRGLQKDPKWQKMEGELYLPETFWSLQDTQCVNNWKEIHHEINHLLTYSHHQRESTKTCF